VSKSSGTEEIERPRGGGGGEKGSQFEGMEQKCNLTCRQRGWNWTLIGGGEIKGERKVHLTTAVSFLGIAHNHRTGWFYFAPNKVKIAGGMLQIRMHKTNIHNQGVKRGV